MTENELNLLHRYLDGAITPGELESLDELLRSSAEARATLRSLATIDAMWQEIAADEAFGRTGEPMARGAGDNTVTAPKPASGTIGSAESRRLMPLWMTVTALATALVVGAYGWSRVPEGTPTETIRGIARVIRIEGEGKAGQDRVVVDGAELFAGEDLVMQQGLIELAFRETGVHVIATAPLKMKLDSDQRVSLHEGKVKLVVPPQGVGFVVDTAQRKFVAFRSSCQAAKSLG